MATFIAVGLMEVDGEARLSVMESTTPTSFVESLRQLRNSDNPPTELLCIQGSILPMLSDGSKIEIAKNEYSLCDEKKVEYTKQPVYLGSTEESEEVDNG